MGLRAVDTKHRTNQSVKEKIPKSVSEHAGTPVVIVDYDPVKHRIKVVRRSDRQPLLKDQTVDNPVQEKREVEFSGEKVLKTGLGQKDPIVAANNEFASVRGNDNTGFFAYREGGGNIIKGPLSLGAEPHQIRISGLTTLNPLFTSGFPSTIVTPIPATVWALPTAAIFKPLLKDVLTMGTIIAAAGSAV